MTVEAVVAVIVAVLTGGGVSAIIIKRMSRSVDSATAQKILTEATGSEIDNLRQIIAEVRDSDTVNRTRIGELGARVARLEERERHMLTRVAVHEAWDQLAFQAIFPNDQNFPEPPPLTDGQEDNL